MVGLLFVAVGARIVQTARRFLRTAQRVPGVVTDLRCSSGSSGSSGIWTPVLRFTTRDGRQVDTTAMYGTNPPPARAGEQVTVLYDPERPARAALHGRLGGRLLGSGLVLLAGLRGRSGSSSPAERPTRSAYRADVREPLTGRPSPGVLPLAAAAVLVVAFALGLGSGPSHPDEPWSPWFGLPLHLLALTLPLLLLVLVVVALTSPPAAGPAAPRRLTRWQVATVVTAGLGLALYLSPWGRAGIAAVLET